MAGINSIRLSDRKEEILCVWEQRCLKEVSSAGTVANLKLRDSLPVYLDHLSEALATNKKMDFKSVVARDEESTRIGKIHGSDRAGDINYELSEVIFEFHILRQVIFQVLEDQAPLAVIQRDIVMDSLEQAVNDAAVEFSAVHRKVEQRFVNTLTHDLKNPIAAGRMNAQVILLENNVPARATECAKGVIRCMDRLDEMINDLLDSSKIRAGETLELQMVECDLKTVLQEVVEEMTLVYGDRFKFHCKESLKGNWTAEGLRRSLENIIVNAVKYGASKTPITVRLDQTQTAIEISVHNEGNPISDKDIPHLFDRATYRI